MPHQVRGPKLVARRAAARPKLLLQEGDLQPSTLVRYDIMMLQLNTLLCMLAGITSDVLIKERAGSAIQVWVCLLMQIHFDCGTAGLSEVGNLLSSVSRALRLSAWSAGGEVLGVTDIMQPLWKAFATWKKVEPYEYRFPLPRTAVHATLGLCVSNREWLLLLFIMLCHHCWLRPAEALMLTWEDLVLDPWLEVYGVVKISNPKIKSPKTQHVIIEDPQPQFVEPSKLPIAAQPRQRCSHSPLLDFTESGPLFATCSRLIVSSRIRNFQFPNLP